jgi:outer membrane protein assembly factor BamB
MSRDWGVTVMRSALSFRRRAGMLGLVLTAVAGVWPAEARTSVNITHNSTWGTAPAADRAGRVMAMLEAGPVVYLAGEFTGLVAPSGGPPLPRPYLAALDVASGKPLAFDAHLSGPVRALALSANGRRLYIGGDFEHAGGGPAHNLAAIDPATGALDPTFTPPRLNSGVRALALAGDRLYVGGNFTEVLSDGQAVPRPQVAALSAYSGTLLNWKPPPNGGGEFFGQTGEETSTGDGLIYDLAVSGDGQELYVAGTFLNLGGRKGLVSLTTTTGKPTAWQPEMDRPVFGITVWPGDGRTLFAAAGGKGGSLKAFSPGGATEPTWEVRTDGDNVGVLASATTVYLLGHYDFIVSAKSTCYRMCPGGPERHHLAAFDAATGALDPWNPTANTSTGPYSGAIGARHLWVGGEFTMINRVSQPGVVQFSGMP